MSGNEIILKISLGFVSVDETVYYRTRELVRLVTGGGSADVAARFVFCGRVDNLAKIGGNWVDVRTIEEPTRSIIVRENIGKTCLVAEQIRGRKCHIASTYKINIRTPRQPIQPPQCQ